MWIRRKRRQRSEHSDTLWFVIQYQVDKQVIYKIGSTVCIRRKRRQGSEHSDTLWFLIQYQVANKSFTRSEVQCVFVGREGKAPNILILCGL